MDYYSWLQSRLTAHRFPVGPIDGILGPATNSAIKAFQASHGLEPTGRVDKHTEALLRAPASTVMPEIKAQIPERDEPVELPAAPAANVWPRQADVMSYYGPVGLSQTTIEVPFDFWLAWDKAKRVSKITVHKKVAESAQHCFNRIGETYSAAERKAIGIDIFGGSLNVRKMRGGSSYSMHSWGIAIDFDPERNQLHWGKDKARLAQPDAVPFWIIWESQGWLSLGRARNMDFMHVQAARL